MEGITIIFLKSKYPEQLSNHDYWNVKYIDVHGQMPLTIFRCQLIVVRQKDMVHTIQLTTDFKQRVHRPKGLPYTCNSPLRMSMGNTDPRAKHN